MEADPENEILRHYTNERKNGKGIKSEKIMMIWSFKRNRHPDETLNKQKARLCCHGRHQQRGVDYWNTYAQVVSWLSVKILLTIVKLYNLHTN